MNKYLIEYEVPNIPNGFTSNRTQKSFMKVIKVRNFDDNELENFCKDKIDIKVTFLCNIKTLTT